MVLLAPCWLTGESRRVGGKRGSCEVVKTKCQLEKSSSPALLLKPSKTG